MLISVRNWARPDAELIYAGKQCKEPQCINGKSMSLSPKGKEGQNRSTIKKAVIRLYLVGGEEAMALGEPVCHLSSCQV